MVAMKSGLLRQQGLKRRTIKKRLSRQLRWSSKIAPKRDLSDHRRWLWMAMSPWTDDTGKWYFDDKVGRTCVINYNFRIEYLPYGIMENPNG